MKVEEEDGRGFLYLAKAAPGPCPRLAACGGR